MAATTNQSDANCTVSLTEINQMKALVKKVKDKHKESPFADLKKEVNYAAYDTLTCEQYKKAMEWLQDRFKEANGQK